MNKKTWTIVSIISGILIVAGLYVVLGFMLPPKGGLVKARTKAWEQAGKKTGNPIVFPIVRGKVIPGVNLKEAFKTTPKALAAGKRIFDTNCAACHGASGKGDGPAAVALTPKPRNFTSPKGWTNGYTLVNIYRTLSLGVKGTTMGDYSTLAPRERFDLAHYVQSFGKFDHGRASKAQIAALNNTFHFTEGIHEPNKVAVPTIMKYMEAGYKAPTPIPAPAGNDESEGAMLYRGVIKNPARAAIILSEIPDWRTNLHDFVNGVAAATPSSGFRANASTLNKQQWQVLQAELTKLIP